MRPASLRWPWRLTRLSGGAVMAAAACIVCLPGRVRRRVSASLRDGECPAQGRGVRYEPVFRREAGGLLSNTVPAFAVGVDGALWFGTAFGLTRFTEGRFTPVPFDTAVSFRGDVTTLEAF